MDVVALDTRDATPIYAQIERGLRAAIAAGRLRPGDQLPTVRQLAVDLRVNANTVARVYSDLERAGVLETRRGVGSFVRATANQARPRKEHQRRLHALAIRVLADAAAAGFTPDELVAEVEALGGARRSRQPGGSARAGTPGPADGTSREFARKGG
jgi:GntR family transcriptional regulator